MRTITFYSYKGGVGRTLALANIAKRLSEFGKKVCLIDFDLEAPGLHHKFKENLSGGIKNGMVDYIHYFNTHKTTPPSLSEYVTRIKFNNKKYTDIDFIAAGNVFSGTYWKTLSSIDWIRMFYKKNSNGVALFVDLKERIKKELNPDYLLIDSRTGISEITGISMSIMADEVVLLVAKNEENIQGLKQIIKSLVQPENTLTGKAPKLNFVLCRIPYFENPHKKIIELRAVNEVDRDLKEFFKEENLPLQFDKLFVIHSEPTLEIKEELLMGYQYEKESEFNVSSPIATDYLDLFEELTKSKLSESEKLTFNNFKKAEYFIEQAQNVSDNTKKIEFLTEAIKLNPQSDDAYSELSTCYYNAQDFQKSLINIDKALEINKESISFLCKKGNIVRRLGEIDTAKQIFENVLNQDNSFYSAIASLGNLYYVQKNYNKALEYYLQIVKFYPDFSGGYNNVANIYRLQENYEEAFRYIYKALELKPTDAFSNGTLAEIYAQQGNENEFYKNFELSLSFDMEENEVKRIITTEDVYKPYLKAPRFQKLLKKYNIDFEMFD